MVVTGKYQATFVYDGSQLAQEIMFTGVEDESEWVYTYVDLTHDYLRQPGGIRQREGTVASHTDYFMTANAGTLEFKTERDPDTETITRNEHTSSMDQMPTSTFEDISNLMTSNGYVEMYGGTKFDETAGFDPLVQRGGRHYLGGLGRTVNFGFGGGGFGGGSGGGVNDSQTPEKGLDIPPSGGNGFGGGLGEPPSSGERWSASTGPIQAAFNELARQCGQDCVDYWIGCLAWWTAGHQSVFYNFCCGIAMTCLTLIEDFDQLWRLYQCRNCICGDPFNSLCGRNCLCDRLRNHYGYPNSNNLKQQFSDYFDARKHCMVRCGCYGQTMYPIPFTAPDECPDEFNFPMPSCYDICIAGGGTSPCNMAWDACRSWCLWAFPEVGTELVCLGCCNAARDHCRMAVIGGLCH